MADETEVVDETDAQVDEPEAAEPDAPLITDEMAQQIFTMRHEAKAARTAEDHANAVYKAAKKRREALEEQLGELLDEVEAGPGPLYANTSEDQPDDEEWRAVDLVERGLSDRVFTSLAEHDPPLTTLGALVDWQAEKGDFWAKDIKGIGEAAEAEIVRVVDDYWEEHPRPDTSGAQDEEGAAE